MLRRASRNRKKRRICDEKIQEEEGRQKPDEPKCSLTEED
jgi:hypothetical protein